MRAASTGLHGTCGPPISHLASRLPASLFGPPLQGLQRRRYQLVVPVALFRHHSRSPADSTIQLVQFQEPARQQPSTRSKTPPSMSWIDAVQGQLPERGARNCSCRGDVTGQLPFSYSGCSRLASALLSSGGGVTVLPKLTWTMSGGDGAESRLLRCAGHMPQVACIYKQQLCSIDYACSCAHHPRGATPLG